LIGGFGGRFGSKLLEKEFNFFCLTFITIILDKIWDILFISLVGAKFLQLFCSVYFLHCSCGLLKYKLWKTTLT
jgi:hypothetical protein